jgi:hypothetical protein
MDISIDGSVFFLEFRDAACANESVSSPKDVNTYPIKGSLRDCGRFKRGVVVSGLAPNQSECAKQFHMDSVKLRMGKWNVVGISAANAVILAVVTGCATNYVTDKAKPQTQYDEKQKKDVVLAKGQPAYYALLPVSIPVDIVTFPVQLVVFSIWPGPMASDYPQVQPKDFSKEDVQSTH